MTNDSEACRRCDGANVVWCAPSPLWNLVMRGNDINGEPLFHDLVCMSCFQTLAEKQGLRGRWLFDEAECGSGSQIRMWLDPVPEELKYVTPSGRVWDDGKWLWVE